MIVIIILLTLILLCMFKPIRQLIGLLFLLFVGSILWHHAENSRTQSTAAPIVQQQVSQ